MLNNYIYIYIYVYIFIYKIAYQYSNSRQGQIDIKIYAGLHGKNSIDRGKSPMRDTAQQDFIQLYQFEFAVHHHSNLAPEGGIKSMLYVRQSTISLFPVSEKNFY